MSQKSISIISYNDLLKQTVGSVHSWQNPCLNSQNYKEFFYQKVVGSR